MILRRLILIILSITTIVKTTNASPPDSVKIKEFQVSSGICSFSSIDNLFSFKIYTGTGFTLNVSYIFGKTSTFHQLSASYSSIQRYPYNLSLPENYDFLDNRYIKLHTLLFDLNYLYSRRVVSGFVNLYISGGLFNSLNKTAGSQLEWFYSGIGTAFSISKSIKKNNFSIEIALPFASIIARNTYYVAGAQTYNQNSNTSYFDDMVKFGFFNKILIIYSKINYNLYLNNKFNLFANYGFRYVKINFPRVLEGAMGNYLIGLTYIF